jgi:hypothetical protein
MQGGHLLKLQQLGFRMDPVIIFGDLKKNIEPPFERRLGVYNPLNLR